MDLSYRETCDGLACATLDQSLFVVGGHWSHLVWELNLPSLEWRVHETTGDVPPPTLFHAVCTYRDYLVVSGGHAVNAGDAIPAIEPEKRPTTTTAAFLKVRLYHPRTQQWSVLASLSGDVPLDRSHHTLTACPTTEDLVLIGGKPTTFAAPTCSQVLAMCRYGFYDVHILHVPTRAWRRIALPLDVPVQTPNLWGHSAGLCVGSTSAIVVYGGFEVHASVQPQQREELPVATVNSCPWVLSPATGKWTVFGSREGEPCPAGRGVHGGHVRQPGGRLAIYGGLAFDEATGEMGTANDYWEWNPDNGKWQAMPFCLLHFSSKRLLSAVYDTALVVVPNLTSVYVNEHDTTGWEFMECDVWRVLHRSFFAAANMFYGLDDPPPTAAGEPTGSRPIAASGSGAAGNDEVSALRNELAALRSELTRLRTGQQPPPPSAASRRPKKSPSVTPPPQQQGATSHSAAGKPTTATTSHHQQQQQRPAVGIVSPPPPPLRKSQQDTIDEEAMRAMRERVVAHLVRSPAVRDATPFYSSEVLAIAGVTDGGGAASHISPVIREYMAALDRDLKRADAKQR